MRVRVRVPGLLNCKRGSAGAVASVEGKWEGRGPEGGGGSCFVAVGYVTVEFWIHLLKFT